jgi:hypothetical protein
LAPAFGPAFSAAFGAALATVFAAIRGLGLAVAFLLLFVAILFSLVPVSYSPFESTLLALRIPRQGRGQSLYRPSLMAYSTSSFRLVAFFLARSHCEIASLAASIADFCKRSEFFKAAPGVYDATKPV